LTLNKNDAYGNMHQWCRGSSGLCMLNWCYCEWHGCVSKVVFGWSICVISYNHQTSSYAICSWVLLCSSITSCCIEAYLLKVLL